MRERPRVLVSGVVMLVAMGAMMVAELTGRQQPKGEPLDCARDRRPGVCALNGVRERSSFSSSRQFSRRHRASPGR